MVSSIRWQLKFDMALSLAFFSGALGFYVLASWTDSAMNPLKANAFIGCMAIITIVCSIYAYRVSKLRRKG